MADIVYTVNQDSPENIVGFEQYSQEDRDLVSSFQINNIFNPTKNYSELHILSLSDELLESVYDYTNYKQSIDAQSAGLEGTSALTIDPIADSKAYGYETGGVKLLYHFLDDLYAEGKAKVEFYIQDISADRTELSLATLNISSQDLTTITSAIKAKLENQSYFTGFRLNFRENDLLIATNIDTLDSPTGRVVVVKLYEPLPESYGFKSTLSIAEVVSDSIAYEIEAEFITPPIVAPTLRSANFNIDAVDSNIIPTKYYNYDELFSFPINNSNNQIFTAVKEKSIDISVDYTDFNDFIHFSSAQERLLNFKYKVDLINSYSASIASVSNATTGLQGVSGSRDYYEKLITGVVSNFDHYERFLYYESGSSCWPKSNTTKPYINKPSTSTEAITWYTNEIANAISYDNTNYNSLVYSIPTYLRDDANNENYLTFVYMVGQHFDNLWLYSKAVTDKYDADNRIDHGISKDLVGEALKNFGVKLYTSNKSVEDLFTTFIGQAYQSGSEKINNYIVAETVDKFIISLPTASIGTQDWTTQNLDVTTYKNGDTIPQVTDTTAWGALTTGAWCYYGNDATSGSVYGKLYNWYAVNDPRGLAPEGYHIPTTEEWYALTSSLGGSGAAGGKMKSTSSLWQSPNVGADNSSGFTGLPGGQRSGTGVFTGTNVNGNWWSSTDTATTTGQGFRITGSTDNVTTLTGTSAPKDAGFSVRLLVDPNTTPVPPTSYDNYQKEIQKRIYHNLPLLLKSKGTERGLRALINCLGIPSDILEIKLYGGRNTNETPFYGDYQYYTSSLDKIRLDNTGSIVTGSTLSSYTSIVKRDNKYTDDLHPIEIGFSPTDNIDNIIISASKATASLANFNIDDYLGDARNLTSDRYHTYSSTGVVTSNLVELTNTILRQAAVTGSYNVQDYVRLIKFFDNTVFKMIKDFIPARAVADTGIIIKPHVLSRSKAKSVKLSGSRPEYTGSIDTAFINGSDGDIYSQSTGIASTAYTDIVQTPQGLGEAYLHVSEEAKFNGELSGSYLRVSNRDLNKDNLLKELNLISQNQTVAFYQDVPVFACALSSPSPLPITITRDSQTKAISTDLIQQFFSGITYNSPSTPPIIPNSVGTFTFPNTNYTRYSVTASRLNFPNPGDTSCKSSASYLTQYCDLNTTDEVPEYIFQSSTTGVNIRPWFSTGSNSAAQFTASWDPGTGVETLNIINPSNVKFEQPAGTTVTITCRDPRITAYTCEKSVNVLVNQIPEQSVVPIVNLINSQTGYYTFNPTNYNPPGYFFTGSTFVEWNLKVTDGTNRFSHNPPNNFELKVNSPSFLRVKYAWTSPGAHPYHLTLRLQRRPGAYSWQPELVNAAINFGEPYIRIVIPPGTGPVEVTSPITSLLAPNAQNYKFIFFANDYYDDLGGYGPGMNGNVKVRLEFF
jgi:uncharacterized protein (TIGR02145 family)